jgi:hypothetical protein
VQVIVLSTFVHGTTNTSAAQVAHVVATLK